MARPEMFLGIVVIDAAGNSVGFKEWGEEKLAAWQLETKGFNSSTNKFLIWHLFGTVRMKILFMLVATLELPCVVIYFYVVDNKLWEYYLTQKVVCNYSSLLQTNLSRCKICCGVTRKLCWFPFVFVSTCDKINNGEWKKKKKKQVKIYQSHYSLLMIKKFFTKILSLWHYILLLQI